MTLTESLVSSFILVSMVTQSGRVFGDSMQALGKSRLRDGVNAIIHRDIERVRDAVAAWQINTESDNSGQLSYAPNLVACEQGKLAEELLDGGNSSVQAGTSTLDLSSLHSPPKELKVSRTISTASDNNNLILITYESNMGKSKTLASSTLVIPAQGWCP